MNRILIIMALSTLGACSSNTPSTVSSAPGPFFDLKSYFLTEIKRLEAQPNHIKKKAHLNENTEEDNVKLTSLEKDLSFFVDSDINKPSWTSKYKVDSIFTGNHLKSITHQATDPGLKVQKLVIELRQDKAVEAVLINRQIQNFLSDVKYDMAYYPDSLLTIEIGQDYFFSRPTVIGISYVWHKGF